ncbi:hypothetical protein MANES_01G230701v8 [Manihot esculenta]|uniref:Uncharacterized protein n=1 Tax=Manihot esculenta TaxID=3983 RepID=A0ACB7IEX2_MANES|nr:hypothetical protein MANES_01G230701v8 [Manihot esculenta]
MITPSRFGIEKKGSHLAKVLFLQRRSVFGRTILLTLALAKLLIIYLERFSKIISGV